MNTITSSQLQYKILKVFGIFLLFAFVIEPLFFKLVIVELKLFRYFENFQIIGLLFSVLAFVFIGFWIALNKTIIELKIWQDYVFHFATEIFIVCWIFFIAFTQEHHYSLIPLHFKITPFNWWLTPSYFGLLLVIPITSFIASLYYVFKRKPASPNVESYLITDNPLSKENGNEDDLGYRNIAKEIYSAINSIYPQRAFTIGINGAWGSGKSSLLYLLENEIDNHNKSASQKRKIRILKFDAWAFKDESTLERNFLKVWADGVNDLKAKFAINSLSQFNPKISHSGFSLELQNFTSLLRSESSFISIIDDRLKSQSNENLYLFVIDDIDRLNKDEILEVMRLSRAVADFSNVIYLMCYDRSYVDKILEKEIPEKNTSYLDKVVNLEFKIPEMTEEDLAEFVVKQLRASYKTLFAEELSERIVSDLKNFQAKGFFHFYVPTLRDAKRFLNSFSLTYKILKPSYVNANIDTPYSFCRTFLLELHFYKFKEDYKEVYSRLDEFNNASGYARVNYNKFLINNIDSKDSKVNELFYYVLEPVSRFRFLKTYFSFKVNFKLKVSQNQVQDIFFEGISKHDIKLFLKEIIENENESDLMFHLDDILLKQVKNHNFSLDIAIELSNHLSTFVQHYYDVTKSLSGVPKSISNSSHLIEVIETFCLDAYEKNKSYFSEFYPLIEKVYKLFNENWTSKHLLSDFNETLIVSDKRTVFVGSSIKEIDNLKNQHCFEAPEGHVGNWDIYRKLHPVLNDQKWITRSEKLEEIEADESHTFSFKRKFFIGDKSKIKKASLWVMADDEALVTLNKSIFKLKVLGFDPNRDTSLKYEIDIHHYLKNGINEINFEVTNHSAKAINPSDYERQKKYKELHKNNPYGLIYKIQLDEKEQVA